MRKPYISPFHLFGWNFSRCWKFQHLPKFRPKILHFQRGWNCGWKSAENFSANVSGGSQECFSLKIPKVTGPQDHCHDQKGQLQAIRQVLLEWFFIPCLAWAWSRLRLGLALLPLDWVSLAGHYQDCLVGTGDQLPLEFSIYSTPWSLQTHPHYRR